MHRFRALGITAMGAGLLAAVVFLLLRPGPGPGDGEARRAPEGAAPLGAQSGRPAAAPEEGAPAKVIPSPGSLEVIVLDAAGAPLAEAAVTIWIAVDGSEDRWTVEGEQSTDRDGRCAIAGLLAGTHSVLVNHPRFCDAQVSVSVPSGEPAVVRLKRAPSIEGRAFIGDRDHPLRGARISIRVGRGRGSWSGTSAATGNEGEFVARTLNPGEWITFALRGYRPFTIEVPVTEEEPAVGLEVIFQEGIHVRGRLLGIGGEPIPDLKMNWEREDAPGAEGDSCRADGEGRFEMAGLCPGRYTIAIETFLEEKREEELPAEPATQDLEIVLDLRPMLEIRVEDAGGKPLPGAEVHSNYTNGVRSMHNWGGKTDREGRLQIRGVPAEGDLGIRTEVEGVGSAAVSADLASDRGPLVLRLAPLGALSVRVTDGSGAPVPSAHIEWSAVGWNGEGATDEAGTLVRDMPSAEYSVTVFAGPLGNAEAERVAVRPGETTQIVITVDSSRCLRFHAIGLDAKPTDSVWLEIRALRPSGASGWLGGRFTGGEEGWLSAIVEAGEYEARWGEPGGRVSLGSPTRVRTGDPPVEIRFSDPPRRGIAGTVLEGGRPAAGACVRLFALPAGGYLGSPSATRVNDYTREDGLYRFDGVERGVERAVLTAKGRTFSFARSAEVGIPAEGTIEGILVEPIGGADLQVLVKGPGGRPVPNARIRLLGDGVPPLEIDESTEEDGALRIPRLPPGRHRGDVAGHPETLRSFDWTEGGGGPMEFLLQVRTR